MLRYSAIRILLLIPIIICVTFIIYWLVDLAPGTVVDTMINEDMSQEDIDALYARYDLDKPMIVRYRSPVCRSGSSLPAAGQTPCGLPSSRSCLARW